jgi:tetratricopeptide (TPR) repeat protein
LKIENLYSLESRLGQVQSTLRSLSRDREERLQEIQDVEAKIRRIPANITEGTEPPTAELLNVRAALHQASVVYMHLQERYQPDHPDLVPARSALAKLQKESDDQQTRDIERARNREHRLLSDRLEQLKTGVVALDNVIKARQMEEASLARRANEVRATTFTTRADDSEYLSLTREYNGLKEFYSGLQKKMEESRVATELEREGRGELIEMVEPPTTPEKPEPPTKTVKLLAGLAGGIGAGLFYVLALLGMRPHVRREAHLQLWAGATLLAEIPAGAPAAERRWLRLPVGTSAILILVLLLHGCGWSRLQPAAHYLRVGDQALARGKCREAILDYRMALRADPRSGTAYQKLSSALLEVGEAEEAYPNLLRAAELLPADRSVQLRLADYTHRVYLSDPARPLTALREIEELAQRLITSWPAESEGYRYLAFVLTERHRPEEALLLLKGSLEKTRRSPASICDLASILSQQRRPVEALELLEGLIARRTQYPPAYDLLYLQLMEMRKREEAARVLLAKWQWIGGVEAGLQYAAHLHSAVGVEAASATLEKVAQGAGSESDALARIGDFWLNRGDQLRAKAAYERGLKDRPDSRSLYISRLVEMKIAQQKPEEGRALLQAELRKAPKEDTLSAYLAALDLDSAEPLARTKARMELETILLRMPRSAFIRYHLGRAYLRIGDTMRAEQHLERCLRLDPNYAPGWLALAEVDYAFGNLNRAEKRVGRLLEGAPNHPGGLLMRARLERVQGRVAEAEESLRVAARAGADQQETLLERATLELQRSRPEESIRLLKSEWTGSEDNEQFILAMASAESDAGHVRSAMERLARGLARMPQSSRMRELYATLLARTGDIPGAIRQVSELRKSEPGEGRHALVLADLLAISGKLRDAVVEYEAAQKTLPRDARVWLNYAAVMTALGDAQRARDAYSRALALDSGNPLAMNNLAYLLARSGQNLDYALQLAQDALIRMPGNSEFLDTIAYVHLRLGMKKLALADLDRLIPSAAGEEKETFRQAQSDTRRGELQQAARRLEVARDDRAVRSGRMRL